MSITKGHTCKICGKNYHLCGNCCIGGLEEDVMWEGYCSQKCWRESEKYKDVQERFFQIVGQLDYKNRRILLDLLDEHTFTSNGIYLTWLENVQMEANI